MLLCQLCLAQSANELLLQADKIRSSNPQEFNRLIARLSSQKSSMMEEDLQYLSLLEAYQASYQGKPKEALQTYIYLSENALEFTTKVRATISLVNIYSFDRNWSKGYEKVTSLIALLPSLEDGTSKHSVLTAAALFYNQVGDYEQSLTYSQQLIGQTSDLRTDCFARAMKFESLLHLGTILSWTDNYEESIQLCDQAGELIAKSLINSYLAQHLVDNGDSNGALELLNQSLQDALSTKYVTLIAIYNALLSEAYLGEGSYAQAEYYANQVVSNPAQVVYTPSIVSAYKTLFEVSKKNNEPDRALQHYLNFAEADKAYLDEVKTKQLAIQQSKLNSIEQANQITLLDKQNQLLRVEADLSRQESHNNQLLIALLSTVLLGIVLWSYKNHHIKLKFRELAETDALTHISNRYHFTQLTENALKFCKKGSQPISLIMFDLDHFKKINDSYGHLTGDWALKAVTEAVSTICRKHDVFGRLGGEEFALLLPGCSVSKAKEIAEQCRSSIERINTQKSGHQFTITASFGVTDAQTSGYVLDDLFANADEASYAAKTSGRNRVVWYQSEQSELESSQERRETKKPATT